MLGSACGTPSSAPSVRTTSMHRDSNNNIPMFVAKIPSSSRPWRVRVVRQGKSVIDEYYPTFEEAARRSVDLLPEFGPKPLPRREPWHRRPENREWFRQKAARIYEKRRAWYREFMAGRNCLECGSSVKLEWHHRHPELKTMPVARMISNFPAEKVLAEIAKCDLLCQTCHRQRHRRSDAI